MGRFARASVDSEFDSEKVESLVLQCVRVNGGLRVRAG